MRAAGDRSDKEARRRGDRVSGAPGFHRVHGSEELIRALEDERAAALAAVAFRSYRAVAVFRSISAAD